MAQKAVTGEAAKPMPVRLSAWAIYDVFETADGESVFVAVVSDGQWPTLCSEFGLGDLAAEPAYRENAGRVAARAVILPRVRETFAALTQDELMARLDRIGLPFAPIARPEDLFDDPHLNHAGGLLGVSVPGDGTTKLPALPVQFGDQRPALWRDVPEAGADGAEVLREAGFTDEEMAALGVRRDD